MVRGHANDLLLPDPHSDDFVFLARRLDYTTEDWLTGAEQLQADIAPHMNETRTFFTKHFGSL